MRLLLDTHTFLWFIGGDSRLGAVARREISDSMNERYLSIASAWEIAIKTNLGKLDLIAPFPTFMDFAERNAIDFLPITQAHLNIVATLPLHHRDPFDRLLVAQSLADDLTLISVDERLDLYPITRLW